MKAVKVRDLTDQTGKPFPRPILFCRVCCETSSANRGDYFAMDPDQAFKHCGRNMELVISRVTFEPVNV